jgi:hypothetical protein
MFGIFKKKKAEPMPVEEPAGPDNATLYLADPSLVGSKVLDGLPGVRSYEGLSEGSSATGLRLQLKGAEVLMNFMPPHMVEDHLAGMAGYAEEMVPNKDRLPYVLSRIQAVKLIIGCVITPGIDEEGEVLEALMTLNSRLNGLFFLGDSLFDENGEPLAGSACEAS